MKTLLVYYSRTGTARRVTEKIAEVLEASHGAEVVVEEIVDRKSRGGILGWLGAVADALRKRKTDIEPVKADVAAADLVVIGGPVWAWTVATAVRVFCEQHADRMPEVAFFCTMGSSGDKGTFKAMEDLCAKTPLATLALKERHVKEDDEEAFIAKVAAFAEVIAQGNAE